MVVARRVSGRRASSGEAPKKSRSLRVTASWKFFGMGSTRKKKSSIR
jgi:hypothetical protein